jgi:hypothetical protein
MFLRDIDARAGFKGAPQWWSLWDLYKTEIESTDFVEKFAFLKLPSSFVFLVITINKTKKLS